MASDCYMTEAELTEYDLHTTAYAQYRSMKAQPHQTNMSARRAGRQL